MGQKEKTSPILQSTDLILKTPEKTEKLTNESMILAIKAVRDGMGTNMAASSFSVPPSILKDRISGRVKHGTNSGPVPYLDESEEKKLVDFW